MVARVKSRAELQAIHSTGIGFIYNDTWCWIHKASCPSVDRMEVYTGPGEDYHPPGAKYSDQNREALVAWFQSYWWPGHSPNYCKTCNP